jgi:hypothetical protein
MQSLHVFGRLCFTSRPERSAFKKETAGRHYNLDERRYIDRPSEFLLSHW